MLLGEPAFTPGVDFGTFVWADEANMVHIRWSGDGTSHTFTGTLIGTESFSTFDTIDFEEDDSVGADYEPDTNFGLYTIEVNGGYESLKVLYDNPNMQETDPIPVLVQTLPPIISADPDLDPNVGTGILSTDNVFSREYSDVVRVQRVLRLKLLTRQLAGYTQDLAQGTRYFEWEARS